MVDHFAPGKEGRIAISMSVCLYVCKYKPAYICLSLLACISKQEAQLSPRDRATRHELTVLNVAQIFVELHLINPAQANDLRGYPRSLEMARIDRSYDTSY